MSELFQTLIHPIGMIGLLGQACFFGRFLVQWIVSEKQGRSTMPLAFWYLSIFGALLVLVYAIWRRDPVFILGQSVGLFVYARNLMMIRDERRRVLAEAHG